MLYSFTTTAAAASFATASGTWSVDGCQAWNGKQQWQHWGERLLHASAAAEAEEVALPYDLLRCRNWVSARVKEGKHQSGRGPEQSGRVCVQNGSRDEARLSLGSLWQGRGCSLQSQRMRREECEGRELRERESAGNVVTTVAAAAARLCGNCA